MDSNLSVECAFCWRILYVVFVKDKGWTFQQFCCNKLLPQNCDLLTLSATLETVRLALVKDREIGFAPGTS